MIELNPEGSEKLYAEIMKWKPKPMNGVILEEAYQVFGEWDFAVLFQANTMRTHCILQEILYGLSKGWLHFYASDCALKGLQKT